MPLYCANQSYSYYERDEDLDLDPQESTLAAQKSALVGVIFPCSREKYRVDNLGNCFPN
jgi:hypothetical protein